MRIEKRMKLERFMLRPIMMRLLIFFCELAVNGRKGILPFALERGETLSASSVLLTSTINLGGI